jgi:hypothetical protein
MISLQVNSKQSSEKMDDDKGEVYESKLNRLMKLLLKI